MKRKLAWKGGVAACIDAGRNRVCVCVKRLKADFRLFMLRLTDFSRVKEYIIHLPRRCQEWSKRIAAKMPSLKTCLKLSPLLVFVLIGLIPDEQPQEMAFKSSGRWATAMPRVTFSPDHPLNVADLAALDEVPGIGPALAQSIISAREAQGGAFTHFDDLYSIGGIGEKKLNAIRDAFTTPFPAETPPADATPVGEASALLPENHLLNTGDAAALDQIPGIGPELAKQIIHYREQLGPFRKMKDLLNVPGIGPKKLEEIWEYFVDNFSDHVME